MLDFYYLSPTGERLDFRSKNIFSDPAWMRKYSWNVNVNNGMFSDITRKTVTYDLDVYFVGENASKCAVVRNAAYELFDRDVLSGKPGRIYVGEYYLECYVQGIQNPVASVDLSKIRSKLSIIATGSKWLKEIKLTFASVDGADIMSGGFDFPYDFPYDYASSGNKRSLYNPSFAASDFVLTIYGGCESPTITIGNHAYGVSGKIDSSERLVIDSRNKTVEKVAQDRSTISWFGKRNKASSIFEPIPPGVNALIYDATMSWDIVLLDERSEPPFEVIADELIEYPDGAVILAGGEYLTVEGAYVCVM